MCNHKLILIKSAVLNVRFFSIFFESNIYTFSYEFLEEYGFEIGDYHHKDLHIYIQTAAFPDISSLSHF